MTSNFEVYHAQSKGDIAASGAMNWNGTAQFKLPASMFPTPASVPSVLPAPTVAALSPANTISFNASSTLAGGVGAHVNVVVDGKVIGSTYVGAKTATYSFNDPTLSSGAHNIQIVYDNDDVVSGQDRNLTLNSITVGGKSYAAQSPNEVYHAAGVDRAATGSMSWNGIAEFKIPAPVVSPTDTISFSASSTLAGGVGSHVSVVVDGKIIGSTTVGAATVDYTFKTTLAPNMPHNVQLVYDNDATVGGKDRNLTLDSLTVNGQTVASTSSLEVYHAQGQGDIASSGAMNWNGTAEFKLPASMFSSTTLPPPPPPAGIYVSATGGANGDGTASNPFSSLRQAITASQSSSTKTIYLAGGTYTLGSTILLGAANSGLTITSLPGANAVLDGGGSLATLVQLNGATGVTLQGLTFQNTDRNSRAAVILNGANGNHIVANHFANNGEGLLLTNSSNNTVSGNALDNSATSAVEVQDQSNGNVFDSNVVNGTGALNTKGGGFFLHGANNNTISNNLVKNTAGIGIGVENWDNHTINVGNVITSNMIMNANASSATNDSGAIYELGRSQVDTHSVISNNYIGGAAPGSHIIGIYLDDYTDGVLVTNNIVTGTTGSGNAMQIHGGSNVTVQNNIFDLGATGGSAVLFQSTGASSVGAPAAMTNNVIRQNIIASLSASPTAFSNISGGTPAINDNFYMDQLSNNFQMSGFTQTNAQYGNAQFADQAAGNYTLGSNSGALAIGFKTIEQSNIGPRPTTLHWVA